MPREHSNQNNKKPFLSSLTAKIVLAIIIFAGLTIVIISGTKFIAEYYKKENYKREVDLKYQCKTDDDCVLVFVNKGCCVFAAVNKKYQDEIEISKKTNLNCWEACQNKAICKNNTCIEVNPSQ